MKKNKTNKNNKNSYSSKALLLIFILALALGLLLGFIFFRSSKTFVNNDMNLTYNTLISEYIDKLDKEKMNEAAIKGMIDYINKEIKDEHTNYFSKKDTSDFTEVMTGNYYGTGAMIYKNKDDPVTISKVFKNSPAEKAGLKEGDQYIKINGEDVTKKSSEELSKMIKGKDKKTYNLIVKRNGEEKEFNITTDIVDIPSVESKVLKENKNKIGYIYISVFAANTDEQFFEELQKLNKENISKIIIDLRYDSGGDLETVVNIASNFLKKDDIIVKIVDKDKTNNRYSTRDNNKKYDLAILVNEQSASGSEVLAAALHDNCNATLIGETTYGKGSVQRTKSLSSGAMFKYTVQKWETSKGEQINKKGIKPDIELKLDKKYFKTYEQDDDNQLNKAIEVLTKEK